MRGPLWLGVSTSTTKPSTTATPRPVGTIGAATWSLRSLATEKPAAAMAARSSPAISAREPPRQAIASAPALSVAAAAAAGASGGSVFRPR